MTHTCLHCGAAFEPTDPRQKYCSLSCVAQARWKRGGFRKRNGHPGSIPGVQEAPHKRLARMSRIEWLGALSDRYDAAKNRGDWDELLRIAAEYERGDAKRKIQPMPNTANRIRQEAQ